MNISLKSPEIDIETKQKKKKFIYKPLWEYSHRSSQLENTEKVLSRATKKKVHGLNCNG